LSAATESLEGYLPLATTEGSASELIDALLGHWSRWDVHEEFYLTKLAPSLVADPNRGDDTEKVLLLQLRSHLDDSEWSELPRILAERREGIYREIESDRLRREAQEIARQKEELERRRREQEFRLKQEVIRQQEEIARARREAERIRVEELRRTKLESLRRCLRDDFLGAEIFHANSCVEVISQHEFQAEKIAFVQRWFVDNLPELDGNRQLPDDEQLGAIAAVHGNIQLIARAGSGKTATLVNRIFFLIKHCGVAPSTILLLAFNKKAASEIRHRLADILGIPAYAIDTDGRLPHVMTFHALAYAIVHPEETLLYDDSETEVKQLSRAFQQVIDDHIQDPNFQPLVKELMLLRWRADWEEIESGGYAKDKNEFLRYRRSLVRETIDGKYVKSFGEKVIANFLFENDIDYRYEQNHWWGELNYRPDFTIPTSGSGGVIVEYFGLAGDPDYDEMAQKKRNYWSARPGWQLLEYTPSDLSSGGLEGFKERLRSDLRQCSVRLTFLSEEEIWRRAQQRAIDNFTKASRTFVGRCRQQCLSPEELHKLVGIHLPGSTVEKQFLHLVTILYGAYLARLDATGEEDFSGLLQRAAGEVRNGATTFTRKLRVGDLRALRYVCIDEFQDFSDLFYHLLLALKSVNPGIELFCVGDDWQAINGFAGSDLKFFSHFEQYLGKVTKLYLSTNYRSACGIVTLGNSLMAGRGKAAATFKKEHGRVLIADLSEFGPDPLERERFKGDMITPAVSRLVAHATAQGREVALLARRNDLHWYVNTPGDRNRQDSGVQSWLRYLKSCVPEDQRGLVGATTVHKYKGLESRTVIAVDVVERQFPLIHPDWALSRILGDTLEKIIDADRRLLYVALTRAIETLVIVTAKGERSPFLAEIERGQRLIPLDWRDYPMKHEGIDRVTVRVSNQYQGNGAGTYAIKDLLKAARYQWDSAGSKSWAKTWPAEDFSFALIEEEHWTNAADGIEVRIYEGSSNLRAVYLKNGSDWVCEFDDFSALGNAS
jgi:DNA helicase-4